MIDSEAETRALGLRIASAAEPGDIIALVGDLGTGKKTIGDKGILGHSGHV